MNKLKAIYTGGHSLKINDLDWMQESFIAALRMLVEPLGENTLILSGVVPGVPEGTANGMTVTGGSVYHNGELYSVTPLGNYQASSHLKLFLAPIIYYNDEAPRIFKNGDTHEVFEVREMEVKYVLVSEADSSWIPIAPIKRYWDVVNDKVTHPDVHSYMSYPSNSAFVNSLTLLEDIGGSQSYSAHVINGNTTFLEVASGGGLATAKIVSFGHANYGTIFRLKIESIGVGISLYLNSTATSGYPAIRKFGVTDANVELMPFNSGQIYSFIRCQSGWELIE